MDCSCPICNELDMQDPREIVESYIEYVLLHDKEDLRELLLKLFSEGYRQGYATAVALRIEEDIETLKYINNKWND